MKKLLSILLLGASLWSTAQTNIGVEEGKFYMQEDSLDISSNARNSFDDNMLTSTIYYFNEFNLGVVFVKTLRVDSITIHFQSSNGSCGRPVQVSYIELSNRSPYTWETGYKPLGTFYTNCSASSVTFEKTFDSTDGLYFQFTMTDGSNPPQLYEFQIWGGEPLITSVTDVLEVKEKEVIGCYNLNGQIVDEETKGFVILRYNDRSTEKRFNY